MIATTRAITIFQPSSLSFVHMLQKLCKRKREINVISQKLYFALLPDKKVMYITMTSFIFYFFGKIYINKSDVKITEMEKTINNKKK